MMALEIGKKVKKLRREKDMTLKELSASTQLSTGFLSQLERGLTTVAIDSLENIANAFEVELAYFFKKPRKQEGYIVRSFEREVMNVEENKFIHYQLTKNYSDKDMFARYVEVLPTAIPEDIEGYTHSGEEFVYVIEGILTVFIDGSRHELYPEDSLHLKSTIGHNWANYTSRNVKLIIVSTPNKLRD